MSHALESELALMRAAARQIPEGDPRYADALIHLRAFRATIEAGPMLSPVQAIALARQARERIEALLR